MTALVNGAEIIGSLILEKQYQTVGIQTVGFLKAESHLNVIFLHNAMVVLQLLHKTYTFNLFFPLP